MSTFDPVHALPPHLYGGLVGRHVVGLAVHHRQVVDHQQDVVDHHQRHWQDIASWMAAVGLPAAWSKPALEVFARGLESCLCSRRLSFVKAHPLVIESPLVFFLSALASSLILSFACGSPLHISAPQGFPRCGCCPKSPWRFLPPTILLPLGHLDLVHLLLLV